MKSRVFRSLALLALVPIAAAVVAQKKPLDHSVYDSWKSIQQRSMSNDGKWTAFAITPQEGDNVVHVKTTDGKTSHTFERGTSVTFSADSRFVVMTIVPKFLEVRQATRDRKPADQRPKNSLLIFDLQTGKKVELPDVSGFTKATDDTGWILYRPDRRAPAATPNTPTAPGAGRPGGGGGRRGGGGGGEELDQAAPAQETKPADQSKKVQGHSAGTEQVLRNLASGEEIKLQHVVSGQFTDDGKAFVYSVSTPTGDGDGIVHLDLASKNKREIVKQIGRYPRFTLDEKASQIAYVTDKDDYKARDGELSIYHFDFSNGKTRLVAKTGSAGIPDGWVINNGGQFGFSKSGQRLLFATRPKPEPDPPAVPDDEKVDLDIWSWTDKVLMSQQLLQAASERNRSYEAVYFIAEDRILQLENENRSSVTIGNNGDGNWGIFIDSEPYRRSSSWNPGYADLYLVNIRNGSQELIRSNGTGTATFSEGNRYLLVSDGDKREILAIDLNSKARVLLNPDGEDRYYDELNDTPSTPGLYGIAGWTKNDGRVLLYDRFDIWALDPTGKAKPENLTVNGRILGNVYRYFSMDPDQEFIPIDKRAWLNVFNERTKGSGVYQTDLSQPTRPTEIRWENMRLGGFQKAKNANVVTWTKQTFEIYPDVWCSDLSFKDEIRLSDANPQQAEYLWGSAEIVEWVSTDGEPLQGILVKPGGFEYGKKYPLVAYFYERESDNLHAYRTPAPSASTINISYFASNGYVVFIPDIPYKIGYPGESAMNAIIPGVHKVLDMGFVDKDRMGIQGQSWGGYQVAYMVTETNMFKAAGAGAPVSNMFSAYGGIRWGSGLVRQMQYEHGQSRIDGTMWDKPLRYLENSPIFFVDKVQTPLLIMSNDRDGAVPWYQGIELFTALRRLDKPSWLLVYNNEDHNLVQRKNRKDLSIRLSQFFDHYLKGAPMPVWMAEGLPAVKKGRTMGTELVPANVGTGKNPTD